LRREVLILRFLNWLNKNWGIVDKASMKAIIPLLLIVACAHQAGPSWVDGIRSGEERLKVKNGTNTLFRRIASDESQEKACKKALISAENDIRNEYNADVPYTLEVLVYDKAQADCAVTLLVGTAKVQEPVEVVSPQKLVKDRSYLAQKYAVTGLRKEEFEWYIKEPVVNETYYDQICRRNFDTESGSIHGNVRVCWRHRLIVGYCIYNECMSKD
jgi:hypothetical protein